MGGVSPYLKVGRFILRAAITAAKPTCRWGGASSVPPFFGSRTLTTHTAGEIPKHVDEVDGEKEKFPVISHPEIRSAWARQAAM